VATRYDVQKRLLTAAGLFGIYTRFPFHLIYSELIAATKIRLFTQETEYLHWKLQDKQWANRWGATDDAFMCLEKCQEKVLKFNTSECAVLEKIWGQKIVKYRFLTLETW